MVHSKLSLQRRPPHDPTKSCIMLQTLAGERIPCDSNSHPPTGQWVTSTSTSPIYTPHLLWWKEEEGEIFFTIWISRPVLICTCKGVNHSWEFNPHRRHPSSASNSHQTLFLIDTTHFELDPCLHPSLQGSQSHRLLPSSPCWLQFICCCASVVKSRERSSWLGSNLKLFQSLIINYEEIWFISRRCRRCRLLQGQWQEKEELLVQFEIITSTSGDIESKKHRSAFEVHWYFEHRSSSPCLCHCYI